MTKGAVAVLAVAALAVALYLRDGDSSSVKAANAVLACVRGAGFEASLEASSTGTQQVTVAHGPGALSPNTTLESSQTSIAYMPSADEAAFFAEEVRAGESASCIPPELVSQHRDVLIVFGLTSTERDRAVHRRPPRLTPTSVRGSRLQPTRRSSPCSSISSRDRVR